jgi:putative nucleotidyltransferase with HDIG domain
MTTMKKNPKTGEGGFRAFLLKNFSPPRPGPAAATALAFFFALALVIGTMKRGAGADPGEFEAGRVAERDVAAGQAVSYVDREATEERLEALEHLVPAVFRYSPSAGGEMRNNYVRFREFAEERIREDLAPADFARALEREFPGVFPGDTLEALARHPERASLLEYASSVLELVIDTGVFALIPRELEGYNPDTVELVRRDSSGIRRERLAYRDIITRDEADELIWRFISRGSAPITSAGPVNDLLLPFITENVFFSLDDTRLRAEEAREEAGPVMKYIERGKLIIRKGFIVTEDNMRALEALNLALPGSDIRSILGIVLVMLLLYGLLVFLGGERITGRPLSDPEIYLVSVLAALYLGGAAFSKTLGFNAEFLPVSLILPTALVVMLPAILINPRLAMILALVLPLGAFLAGSFDTPAYTFALFSGVVASYALQGAEKRMDLVRAGLIIGGANCVSLAAILLIQRAPAGAYPAPLFWGAFNGVASGMLVLGLLPPLEQALNAATSFRLIELSDLNAPVLKRLFSAAPGTYSHSIMVANLAEAAAQEIGANPLLARVGAYYHDIGKMEQPDYFVENQTVYNKHNDLSPRLSATVIRSHVKIGVEKARSLGLPRAVTEIVAEHHGNSVITWFYNEALKREGQVNMEDFTYPGNPPRSRESAVVMLADMTEAAVRTLKKPTAAKIEKFIQELFGAKVDHGQLAESDLTFRDLEIIKKAFVRVLAGHYHSRIEYPKLPGELKNSGDKGAGEPRPGGARPEGPQGASPPGAAEKEGSE